MELTGRMDCLREAVLFNMEGLLFIICITISLWILRPANGIFLLSQITVGTKFDSDLLVSLCHSVTFSDQPGY